MAKTIEELAKTGRRFEQQIGSTNVFVPKASARVARVDRIAGDLFKIMRDTSTIIQDQRQLTVEAVKRMAMDKSNQYAVDIEAINASKQKMENRTRLMAEASEKFSSKYEEFDDRELQEVFDTYYTRPANKALASSFDGWSAEQRKIDEFHYTDNALQSISTIIHSKEPIDDKRIKFDAIVDGFKELGKTERQAQMIVAQSMSAKIQADLVNDNEKFKQIVNKDGTINTEKFADVYNSYFGAYSTKDAEGRTHETVDDTFVQEEIARGANMLDSFVREYKKGVGAKNNRLYKEIMLAQMFEGREGERQMSDGRRIRTRFLAKAEFVNTAKNLALELNPDESTVIEVQRLHDKAMFDGKDQVAADINAITPSSGLPVNPDSRKIVKRMDKERVVELARFISGVDATDKPRIPGITVEGSSAIDELREMNSVGRAGDGIAEIYTAALSAPDPVASFNEMHEELKKPEIVAGALKSIGSDSERRLAQTMIAMSRVGLTNISQEQYDKIKGASGKDFAGYADSTAYKGGMFTTGIDDVLLDLSPTDAYNLVNAYKGIYVAGIADEAADSIVQDVMAGYQQDGKASIQKTELTMRDASLIGEDKLIDFIVNTKSEYIQQYTKEGLKEILEDEGMVIYKDDYSFDDGVFVVKIKGGDVIGRIDINAYFDMRRKEIEKPDINSPDYSHFLITGRRSEL